VVPRSIDVTVGPVGFTAERIAPKHHEDIGLDFRWRVSARDRFVVVAFVVALLATTRSAYAYRPFDGTDADVAELGDFEIELGPIGYLRQAHSSFVVAPAFVGNLGFLPRWELVFEGNGVFGAPSPQLLDTGLFLKHTLREGSLQGKSGLSLATEVGALLPLVNSQPGAGVYLGMIASQAWRELTIHVNFEVMRARDGLGEVFIGAIFEGNKRHRIRPVAELWVDTHAGVTTTSGLAGFIWRVNERFSVDTATRLATSELGPVFEMRCGFTWALSLK
jgi:hypothetical protein